MRRRDWSKGVGSEIERGSLVQPPIKQSVRQSEIGKSQGSSLAY